MMVGYKFQVLIGVHEFPIDCDLGGSLIHNSDRFRNGNLPCVSGSEVNWM